MILYFSGTGNSEYVAKRIAQKTEDEVLNLFDRLRNDDVSEIQSDKPWVIVAPTYAWQMPHIVRDWLKRAQLTGDPRVYFVLTCGTSIGGAGAFAKAVASEMGKTYKGTAPVVMPENYIAIFNTPGQEKAMEIVDRAEEKIDRIAETINEGAYLEELGGGRLPSMVMNWGFHKFIIADRKFRTNENCTSCGQCVKVCPTENIYLDSPEGTKRHPVWSGRCIHCMACINRCPFRAIEYGSSTESKERYRCPKTV
ncbi:MAG: EFR1 family ferrodoxin [Firmicutes bacterium]|nr:EFR1 family ferrodoxin [Bacillota bacterium]